ncbi:MAG: hypothetical protein AMXMBFR83_31550 [Phycisphaerae bacterium]
MKRLLRRWRWVLAGLAVMLLGCAATLWLLFQHIPAWYRPARIPLAELQRVRDDWLAATDRVNVQLNRATGPFQVTLTQDQLNEWLAVRESIEPLSRNWLPPSIQEPMVVLEKGAVRLGATYAGDGVSTVLSVRVVPAREPDGIRIRLDDLSGGSLGLPDFAVRAVLEDLDNRLAGSRSDGERPAVAVKDLLDGVLVPNTVRWPGGGSRVRIVDVRIEPGTISVTLERLPRPHSNR